MGQERRRFKRYAITLPIEFAKDSFPNIIYNADTIKELWGTFIKTLIY